MKVLTSKFGFLLILALSLGVLALIQAVRNLPLPSGSGSSPELRWELEGVGPSQAVSSDGFKATFRKGRIRASFFANKTDDGGCNFGGTVNGIELKQWKDPKQCSGPLFWTWWSVDGRRQVNEALKDESKTRTLEQELVIWIK